MASLTPRQQKAVIKFYTDGFTTNELADKYGVSIGAIFYVLRKYNIPRRANNVSAQIRFNRSPITYKIKSQLTRREQDLKLSAIMLYWAEGYKRSTNTIDFANPEVEMCQIFIAFLRLICGVKESKIRIYLYCYEGQNVESIVRYWSKALNIPISQFTKPYIAKSTTTKPTEPRMVYGLAHIRYNDKRLLRQLLHWIQEYKSERRW
jgi:predicted DNA-binding protein YlxM (UPF0122 family)